MGREGNMTQEELGILWLAGCTDWDNRTAAALLRAAKSPSRLLEEYEKIAPSVIHSPDARLYKERGARFAALEKLEKELEREGCFAVTVLSDDYPESLRNIASPPLLLYAKGNRALLSERKFCIVGSRVTAQWAASFGKDIAAELSKHFCIVTGLAEGGDLAAVEGALPSGRLISVLPCGLKECYPASHFSYKEKIAKGGLILSEYPLSETVKKYSFHERNRLLAGLSEGVLVLSAGERSGALITANCAAEFGRDVFALPYRPGETRGVGCNELIKKGALLTTSAEDILSFYGFESGKEEAQPALTPQEAKVYEVLKEGGELHSSVIAERAGMRVFEAAAVLSSLEIKGFAVKAGGNRYSIAR